MFSKLREAAEIIRGALARVPYEPVLDDVYDLDDAPLDSFEGNPVEIEGDNSLLASDQPKSARPSDIEENE